MSSIRSQPGHQAWLRRILHRFSLNWVAARSGVRHGSAPEHAAMAKVGEVRKHSEDRRRAVAGTGLFIVADGMGKT